MRLTLSSAILAAVLCACAVVEAKLVAAPGEQVTSFDADITVNPDSSLTVREDFTVHSEGSYFKYGFIRDLPIDDEARADTRYAGKWVADNGIRVKILELTENGAPADYQQSSGVGYPQLRIGPRDVPLAPGDHRYVIRYTVFGALNLGAAHDMLYWNAIGHYWGLPIREARVRVHLPPKVGAAADVTSEARAGYRGRSTLHAEPPVTAEPLDGGGRGAVYSATDLGPLQSLSVVVTWPAGAIQKPALGIWTRDKWYLAAPIALCLFYFLAWLRIGRPLKPGTVVVRYEPPPGISPAAARFLTTTGSDGRSLAAVIASLAAHGCLRVEALNGAFKLTRLTTDATDESKLAPEEKLALVFLFENGPSTEISPATMKANSARNSRYVANIQGDLASRFDGLYFTRHIGYIALGVLATFVMAFALAATAQGRDTSAALFITTWVLFCGLIIGAIVETGILPAWVRVFRGMARWTALIGATVAVSIFGAVFVVLRAQLARGVSPAYSLMVAAMAMVNLLWAPWLKRMTQEGRATLDAIEGFRQFLMSVEQDRLERLNASAAEPAADAEFLPYAIALEVREAWGDHLADALFATTSQR